MIVLLNVCFEYQSYGGGGNRHCFLRMDTGLVYGQVDDSIEKLLG